jgi:hypothetical protein
MPIRNPFRKTAPGLDTEETPRDSTGGFQTTSTTGAKPIDVKEPLEYKLSGKPFGPSDPFLAITRDPLPWRADADAVNRNQRQRCVPPCKTNSIVQ